MSLIYFSEYFNEVAARNWQSFSRQQYFDSNGLFISTVFCIPMLLNCMILIVRTFKICVLFVFYKFFSIVGKLALFGSPNDGRCENSSTKITSEKGATKPTQRGIIFHPSSNTILFSQEITNLYGLYCQRICVDRNAVDSFLCQWAICFWIYWKFF